MLDMNNTPVRAAVGYLAALVRDDTHIETIDDRIDAGCTVTIISGLARMTVALCLLASVGNVLLASNEQFIWLVAVATIETVAQMMLTLDLRRLERLR